jgi:hypothetical protein
MPVLVSLTPPGQVVPEWARYKVAVVTDLPGDVTVVLVDPGQERPLVEHVNGGRPRAG